MQARDKTTYETSPTFFEDRPRCADLTPLLSMLVFLSGSLFSASRVSRLGRLDATDGLRVNSVRDALRGSCLSEKNRLGMVSARLGSVSSRISDRGRARAQEVMLVEWPLESPWALATMPPLPSAFWCRRGDVTEGVFRVRCSD